MKPKPPTEFQEQCALIRWLELSNILHYAIPNGGKRQLMEAVNLKRSGTKAGVPDICVPIARNGYHGLYIELKKKSGGGLTIHQRIWLKRLQDEGYRAEMARGFDQAKAIVEEYLGC